MIPKKRNIRRYGIISLVCYWTKDCVYDALTGRCRLAYIASLNFNVCSALTTFDGAKNYGASDWVAGLFTAGLGSSLFFIATVVAAGRCSRLRVLMVWPLVASFSIYTNALGLSEKFTVELNQQEHEIALKEMFRENMQLIRAYAQEALNWASERHDRGRLNDDYEPTKQRWVAIIDGLPLLPPPDRDKAIALIKEQFTALGSATVDTWHTFVAKHPVPLPVIKDPPPAERGRAVFARARSGSAAAQAIVAVSVLIDAIPMLLMLLTKPRRSVAQRLSNTRKKWRSLRRAFRQQPPSKTAPRQRPRRHANTVRDFRVVGGTTKGGTK